MYTDGVLQKPKTLKKVKRLKHKSARHQEKHLDPFYLINESVRTAREISSTVCSSVPSDHDPMMVEDVEYAKCHDTSVQRDIDDILGSLHSSRRNSPSPFIECTLIITSPTKEEEEEEREKEEELSLHDETTTVQITTRNVETATVMRRMSCSEHSENTSILILSTDSLSLIGDELQDPGISFDNGADSSIVLDTDEERDEELLFSTDDNITITITPDDSDKKKSLLEGKQVMELNQESENVIEKSSSSDVVLVPPIIGIPLKNKNENALPRNIVESFHQRLSSPHDNKDDGKSPDVPQQVSPEAEKLINPFTESVGMPAEKRSSVQRNLHPSLSFERYVQEGRAKRQLQEVLAEQQRQRELQEIRFTPQVSSYAAQRVSRSVSEYITASQQWEEQRQAHVKRVAARLEDAAREEYAACVKLNPTSRRIVIEMIAQKRRVNVMEGLQQHAAAREMRMRELQEKYTPTFQPAITPAAQRQKRGMGNHKIYMRGKENTSHQRESEKISHMESKYQPKKRSTTAIREHVEAMLARDAARRAKSQQRAENIRREEEKRMRTVKPQVNPHSAQLAERHRQRQRIKEEKLATAESNKYRSTSRNIQQQGVMHKNNLSPDAKGQHEEQNQQTIPTNRKLVYSSSGTRGNSRMRSSCGSKQQQHHNTTTSLLSPEFEERNTRLLQQRQLRAESRRRKLDEEFAQTCTFRPQTNSVSRRMAADAHYSYMEPNSHYMRRPSAAPVAATTTTAGTTSTNPPLWASNNNIEDDFEWAEYVRRATYSVENSDTPSRGCSNAQQGHNDINYHHDNKHNIKNNNNNDDNGVDDLSSQIESLEAMLAQWKQLEAEFRV